MPVPDFLVFLDFLPWPEDSGTAGILDVSDLRRSVSESASAAAPTRSPTDRDPLGPGASEIEGSDEPGEAGDVPDRALDLDLSEGTAGTLGAGLNKPDSLLAAPAARPVVFAPWRDAS